MRKGSNGGCTIPKGGRNKTEGEVKKLAGGKSSRNNKHLDLSTDHCGKIAAFISRRVAERRTSSATSCSAEHMEPTGRDEMAIVSGDFAHSDGDVDLSRRQSLRRVIENCSRTVVQG